MTRRRVIRHRCWRLAMLWGEAQKCTLPSRDLQEDEQKDLSVFNLPLKHPTVLVNKQTSWSNWILLCLYSTSQLNCQIAAMQKSMRVWGMCDSQLIEIKFIYKAAEPVCCIFFLNGSFKIQVWCKLFLASSQNRRTVRKARHIFDHLCSYTIHQAVE